MNGYIVIAITIVALMTVALAVIFGNAIAKGKRAGHTEIEVKIAGIFSVKIHLTDNVKDGVENSG